jgi:hypothetical protein
MPKLMHAADVAIAARTASTSAPKPMPVPKDYVSYRVKPRTAHWSLERSRASDGSWVVTVSDGRTGIYGAGSDANEAIRDLMRARREHREVLESQTNLSPALKRQLNHLKER